MKNLVMTGGSSGLGAVTVQRLLESGEARILLGVRGVGPTGVETPRLDLGRLDSVREFAAEVGNRLGEAPIDALVMNAGVSMHSADTRTTDGFETTFAVNHLAHYLLLRLLMPKLAPGAIITLSTSATHDPAAKTILPVPRHADAQLLAHPDEDPERDTDARKGGGRAYTTSKLCNILTARALAATPEAKEAGWTVVAYDPGPTPGTGLLRETPAPVRAFWALAGTPLRVLMPRFNSRAAAGGELAKVALGRVVPPAGKLHARVVKDTLTWPAPSQLAQSDDAMEALWRDSAKLVGLTD